MSHLLHYLPATLANTELTQYRLVKYQHDNIFYLIKRLKDKIKNHIKTEESLMNYRNDIKSELRIDDDELIKHKEKNKVLLEKLDGIKEEFETHIKLYDNIHIHKL